MGSAEPITCNYEEAPDSIDGEFFSGVEDRMLMLQQMAGKAKKATQADLREVSRRADALKRLISQDAEMLARFKIEVHLAKHRRTNRGFFPGIILVWKTGVLSGGGDEIMYPCPDKSCGGYLSVDNRPGEDFAICPMCGTGWHRRSLKEVSGYKQDLNGWANIIARIFRDLGSMADIILKTGSGGLREAARIETQRERRGDNLYAARRKVVVRYAVGAILRDTMNSSLESRIKGFLRA